jgi:hypothetical protein
VNSPQWPAVAVSLAAFVIAAMSYIKSSAAARAQVLLEFRKRFSELKGSIPAWYSAPTIPDGVSAAVRAVERYWQNAFDEWFVTTKLERWALPEVLEALLQGDFQAGAQQRPAPTGGGESDPRRCGVWGISRISSGRRSMRCSGAPTMSPCAVKSPAAWSLADRRQLHCPRLPASAKSRDRKKQTKQAFKRVCPVRVYGRKLIIALAESHSCIPPGQTVEGLGKGCSGV